MNRREWTTTELRRMVALFRAGLTAEEVGIKLGRSPESVKIRARREGVSIRQIQSEALLERRRPHIRAFLDGAINVDEAAHRCGIKPRAFYKMLDGAGITWDKHRDFYGLSIDQEREVYRIWLDEGLSVSEIARQLDTAPLTVRRALCRYRRRLKGELEPTDLSRLEAA